MLEINQAKKAIINLLHVEAIRLYENMSYYLSIKCYDKILAFNSLDKYAWTKKGVIYSILNLNENALSSYNEALLIDPKYNYAMNLKKLLLLKYIKHIY